MYVDGLRRLDIKGVHSYNTLFHLYFNTHYKVLLHSLRLLSDSKFIFVTQLNKADFFVFV